MGGFLIKAVDAVMVCFLVSIVVGVPVMDSQVLFPVEYFPKAMVDVKLWFVNKSGDYLFEEKPHFFVGLVWLELLFQWPLAIANLYGLLAAKSWFPTTSLIYGASLSPLMVAVLADLVLSKRASQTLLAIYAPYLGFAFLAMLRGLVTTPQSGKTTATATRNKTRTK